MQPIQGGALLAYNRALLDLKFLSQKGHVVIFYQEGTQLKAEVEEELHHGFSQLYHLPVGIAHGKRIDQIMYCAIGQPNPLIHVHLPKGKQPGRVYVGNVGLMGGGHTGGDKVKEKLTEDEGQERSNGTAQAATDSLADEQIVAEKEHEVAISHTALHMAALNGDLVKVRSLLLSGSPINARDQLECTPLHRAASRGHIEILRLLLEQGANPYAAEYNGMSALHFASLHGHLPAVNLLLQRTDVNVQDKDGYTPLFLATRSGHIPIIKALINRGANVNAQNKLGNTPLYEAVRRANLPIVKLLYSKGADFDVQNIYGWTPLHLAVGGCKEIVNYLVARGADINIKHNGGLTPIDLAMQGRQVSVAELLLKTEGW
jgi:ankyrin repeat protein